MLYVIINMFTRPFRESAEIPEFPCLFGRQGRASSGMTFAPSVIFSNNSAFIFKLLTCY